jgi:uncharacterized membrane protein YsdA (DUF1294 family)/cold shock CspA family protein
MPPPTGSNLTAKIVEWDRQKGYGFLQVGKQRVFLHRRDFIQHHKKPAVGDDVRCTLGKDAKGRTCATNAAHVNDGGRVTVANVLVTFGLLVLPGLALQRQAADFRWVGAYMFVLSALTYWAYAVDKRRAQEGLWRVPEAWLNLLELLGGWPGAFLAQRWLRHKCSKGPYQVVFWLIVLVYQFVAFDSLRNWQLSRAAFNRIEASSGHRR